jgi:hypothetical protein
MVRSDFGASRGLLPSPAFGECRHGSLARRGIAMRGRAILVVSKRKRPHPRRAYGRRIGFEDAADNDSIDRDLSFPDSTSDGSRRQRLAQGSRPRDRSQSGRDSIGPPIKLWPPLRA